MLKTPTWTLKKALHTVLDNAQDYLADVSFHYGETTLWAHRAILLARIPESFLKKYLSPILGEKSSCAVTVLDIERLVPLSLIQPLLRFWYTSEFLPSHTEPPPSLDSAISTSSSSDDDHIQSIRTQLRQLEDRLKVQLLPCNNTDSTDFDRLVSDLERMRDAQLAMDVIISIFSPLNISKHKPSQQKTSATDNGGAGLAAGIPSIVFSHADDHDSSDAAAPPSFPAHRFILASQSPYFYAMFCGDFREASTSTIHLPADLFNTISTQVIINYFYTGKVSVPSYSPEANPSPNAQQRLTQKKYSLRVLQQVFAAADYLGHFDTICLAALNEMEACCHQLKCHCSDCAVLLPSMLWFADKNADVVPEMREKLISLYAEDPIHNIAPLWSQKPFAVLVGSLWTPSSSTEALVPLENEEKTLVSEIASLVLENITKYNAIHVLHSLHLCLSQIRSANPMPTWSTPLLDLLNPIIHHTVDMVSQNFDFYCTEYPILLSCIDGIGHGFSVDFLEFLLNRVLSGGIQDDNAGILYQGIVRDLVGRQQVVKNVAVDGVLVEARQKCVRYLSRRWPQVKAQNGFKKIDKETMRHLADDLGVPYRTLAKPFESDFSAIFSFRPKASKKSRGSEDSGGGVRKSHSEASPPRRLSLSALRSQISSNGSRYAEERNSSESDIATTKVTRSRSLSKDFTAHSMISDNLSAENIDKLSAAGLSSQSLIHMLSLESESRRQRLEAEANYNPQPLTTLADALLPLDLSSEVDEHPRPSRLKFALPTAPLRAKSPVQKPFLAPTNTASGNEQGRRRSNRRGRSPRRSRWGIGSSSDLSDDEELVTMVTPVVGSKVELLRRPLPTLGTIKYIGPVNFARGTWVGVELESRLGKNDGAVDGTRYFQTDHQRGVFVKVDDFKIISLPNQSTKDSRTITPTHASALEA